MKNAKDVQALKAVSQNLMHSNLSITDGVYGILSEHDIREQIIGLGKITIGGNEKVTDLKELISSTKMLINRLDKEN
jgi:hypothetical protein